MNTIANTFPKFRVLALFLALTGIFAFGNAQHDQGPTPADHAPLPDFEITKPDGTKLTKDGLIKRRPVIVFYFDPDCEHCNQQALWVVEEIMSFKGTNLLWMSWGELDQIDAFGQKYFMGGSRAIQLGKDMNYQFDNWFGYSEVPSIYVYDANWQRVGGFNHETKPAEILKLLQN